MKKNQTNERPQTVQQAFEQTGRPKVDFSVFPEDLREYFEATYNCVVVCESLNKGKRIDLFDDSKPRYYPWFVNECSPARFRLDITSYDYSDSSAGSGSRLSLITDEDAEYAGDAFSNEFCNMLSK